MRFSSFWLGVCICVYAVGCVTRKIDLRAKDLCDQKRKRYSPKSQNMKTDGKKGAKEKIKLH